MDGFLNLVVSNTALAGGLALAAFGLQRFRRSPQLAHALWLLVLVKLVTPPLFPVALPDRFVLSASRAAALGSSDTPKRWQTPEAEHPFPPAVFLATASHRDGDPLQATIDSSAGTAQSNVMSADGPAAGAWGVSNLATGIAAKWQNWVCGVWAAGVMFSAVIL